MIKLEFPADRTDIALAFGKALLQLRGEAVTDGGYLPVPAPAAEEHITDADYTEPPSAGEHVADSDYPPVGVTTPEQPALPADVADDLPDPAQVDHHGVSFDPEFCSSAKQPFYESGPMSGQWKKKRGIDEAAYTAWYDSHDVDDPPPVEAPAPAPDTDTAAAFSADAPPPSPAPGAPQTFGDQIGRAHV